MKSITNNNATTADLIQQYCFGNCPQSWYKWGTDCFYLSSTSSAFSNVSEARNRCLQNGSDLISISNSTTERFFDFIFNQSAKLNNVSSIEIYIGANNITTSSYSQLNGQYCLYTNWDISNLMSTAIVNDNRSASCVELAWNALNQSSVWRRASCCSSLSIAWMACQKPENYSLSTGSYAQNIFAQYCYAYNKCLSNPCLNNASCTDNFLSFSCSCIPGYTGIHCETAISSCSSIPCLNGGTCNPSQASYTCDCQVTYTGTNCETITNQCDSYPCLFNGTCTPFGSDNYTCTCFAGTTGINCETNFNDCVNITCSNGGTCVDGINTYSCLCAQSYTGTACQTHIVCSSAPTVINATLINATGSLGGSSYSYGAILVYECIPRHKFADMQRSKVFSCLNPGSYGWNETLLSCQLNCDFLPSVGNAQIGNAKTIVGNTVNFTCDVGFILANNQTTINSTCLADGNWTTNLSNMTCYLRQCPILPFWPYQTLDTLNNTYNTTVTFWCDVGYVLYDNTTARTIKCLADGQWTADLPPCLPVQCPTIALPLYATRNTTNNTYMTYAQYSCNSGYRMLDGSSYRIILCDATAEWSDIITDCSANRCFPLPYVANATPSTTDANFWNSSNLTCIKGHRFVESNGAKVYSKIMTCQSNHWWSPILTSCEPVLCPQVPTNANINPSTLSQLYSTVVQYTCVLGFYIYPWMNKTMSIECLDTEQWNNTIVYPCWPIVCPSPPDIINGTRTLPSSGNFNYSQLTFYECNTNYKFIDGRTQKNLRCNELGSWNETDVSCRSDRCTPANITSNSFPDTTNTSWYSNITYHCNLGYQWGNKTKHSIMCLPGGVWNDSFSAVDDCQIKYCHPVEQMPNATVNTTDYMYNTFAEYTCSTGFKYSDNTTTATMWCSDNAQWIFPPTGSTVFPTCNIIHCPSLLGVENATRDSNDTYYDKTITYSCLPGYQYPDKRKQINIWCTENATWTAYPPPCEVIFCPPLPYWTLTIFNTTDNNFLSDVSYWCSDGAAFSKYKSKPGNQTVLTSTCLANKQWYPVISECQSLTAINADLVGKSYESPQAVPIGTVACSAMCIVLALVVILDLTKIISDLKMMKDNILNSFRPSNKVGNSSL